MSCEYLMHDLVIALRWVDVLPKGLYGLLEFLNFLAK